MTSPDPSAPPPRRFERYVALGDSSTEGLDDPIAPGRYRGWADRFAALVDAAQHPAPLLYANLAIRGRKTRAVRDEQLPVALAMRPDLATVFAGTNDLIRSAYDESAVLADLAAMHRALRAQGATVLTITMPDLSGVMPAARRIAPRLRAFNAAVRALADETGSLVADLAQHPVASDVRLWSEDRLHANSEGHRRVAAALAHRLGLPQADAAWAAPLPPAPRPSLGGRAMQELRWTGKYLLPWLLRRALGRSSGDGVVAKRPTLLPVSE